MADIKIQDLTPENIWIGMQTVFNKPMEINEAVDEFNRRAANNELSINGGYLSNVYRIAAASQAHQRDTNPVKYKAALKAKRQADNKLIADAAKQIIDRNRVKQRIDTTRKNMQLKANTGKGLSGNINRFKELSGDTLISTKYGKVYKSELDKVMVSDTGSGLSEKDKKKYLKRYNEDTLSPKYKSRIDSAIQATKERNRIPSNTDESLNKLAKTRVLRREAEELAKANAKVAEETKKIRVAEAEANKTSTVNTATKNMNKLRLASRNTKESIVKDWKNIGAGLKDMGGGLVSVGHTLAKFFTLPLLLATKAGLDFNSVMQQSVVNLTTMMGSIEDAKKMSEAVKNMALSTPLTVGGTQKAAVQLMAFGMKKEKVMPAIKAIGDVSLGDNDRFERLTLAYAQTQAAGKLMGQDLLQMVNAGFNPLLVISEKTGKSLGDLRKEMENGGISADMIADAFTSATSAGGRFFNGMANASQTLKGQLSIAMETLQVTLGVATKGIFDKLTNDILPKFTDALKGISAHFSNGNTEILKYVGALLIAGPAIFLAGKALTFVGGAIQVVSTGIQVLMTLGKVVFAGALPAMIASLVSPIGLVTAAVVGLGAALVGIKIGKEIGRINTSIGMQKGLSAVEGLNEIRELTKSYAELKEKASLSADEQTKFTSVIADLKAKLPELDTALLATANKYKALKEIVDSTKESMSNQKLTAQQKIDITTGKSASKKRIKDIDYDISEIELQKQAMAAGDAWNKANGVILTEEAIQADKEALDLLNLRIEALKEEKEELIELIKLYDELLKPKFVGPMPYTPGTKLSLLGEQQVTTTKPEYISPQSDEWKSTFKDMIKSIKEAIQGLTSMETMFSRVERKGTGSVATLTRNMTKNTARLKEWATSLTSISKILGAGSENFVNQLREWGPEYTRSLKAMIKDPDALREIFSQFNQGQEAIAGQMSAKVIHEHKGIITIQGIDENGVKQAVDIIVDKVVDTVEKDMNIGSGSYTYHNKFLADN